MSVEDQILREANRRLVERRGPDGGVVVRRETKRGMALGGAMKDDWEAGKINAAGVPITAKATDGSTLRIIMFGVSEFGDGDVFG